MDIDKIEMLLLAIDMGSFSKAAEKYLYTPSAMSHIADLAEEQIGVKFIKRTHAGISVRDGCDEIINSMRRIVSEKNKLLSIAKKLGTGEPRLTIATYSSLARNMVMPAAKKFRALYPNIGTDIIVDDYLSRAFKEGGADIILGEDLYRDFGVWCEITDDPYVAVFPKNADGCPEVFSREYLENETFIMPNSKTVADYLSGYGCREKINVNSNDDGDVARMVADGLGVSILPFLSVNKYGDEISVKPLEIPLKRTIGAVYKKNSPKRALIIEFIKLIEKTVVK